eukprot:TRINITY_DN7010_c0_g1_i3.p1 TRINITY_DN7010_c0_g1~~TRINITY_DN7010_c0_g1_i3.p1  ORF type:complete len:214 (+),score=-4.06 TRINITY_DN7010_c0_g1_i3:67-642(+)
MIIIGYFVGSCLNNGRQFGYFYDSLYSVHLHNTTRVGLHKQVTERFVLNQIGMFTLFSNLFLYVFYANDKTKSRCSTYNVVKRMSIISIESNDPKLVYISGHIVQCSKFVCRIVIWLFEVFKVKLFGQDVPHLLFLGSVVFYRALIQILVNFVQYEREINIFVIGILLAKFNFYKCVELRKIILSEIYKLL